MQLTDVKKAMAHKLPVRYMDIDFEYIQSCILWIKDNEWQYSLELYKNNSVVRAKMNDVEVKG